MLTSEPGLQNKHKHYFLCNVSIYKITGLQQPLDLRRPPSHFVNLQSYLLVFGLVCGGDPSYEFDAIIDRIFQMSKIRQEPSTLCPFGPHSPVSGTRVGVMLAGTLYFYIMTGAPRHRGINQ